MNSVEKLFGNPCRVKVLRMFLLSPERIFTVKEVAKLAHVSGHSAQKEIRFLLSLGFCKKNFRSEEKKYPHSKKTHKTKVLGFIALKTSPLFSPLRTFLVSASPSSREKILTHFKNNGKVMLVVLGGIFLDGTLGSSFEQLAPPSPSLSSLDILVVGNNVVKARVDKFIKKLEAETGRELSWALLSVSEFEYRQAMHDKFLKDLFVYPHEILIDRLETK